jgi:hypothetical protein
MKINLNFETGRRYAAAMAIALCINATAQTTGTVQSSCTANDSITRLYYRDAQRMTVRETHFAQTTYKDSINIDKATKQRFLKALLAVYNATALSVHDTLFSFTIHTSPVPDMQNFTIKAPGSLGWMQKFKIFSVPTGDGLIDQILAKWKVNPVNYYQSATYDVAVMKTDSSLNLTALTASFAAQNGVVGTEILTGSDDSQNITATVSVGYMDITYTYGWSTCHDGCDHHIYWHFRVFDDCVVKYNGWTGDRLDTGVPSFSVENTRIVPNPFSASFWIDAPAETFPMNYTITDLTGRGIAEGVQSRPYERIVVPGLARGLYIVRLEGRSFSGSMRLIKD